MYIFLIKVNCKLNLGNILTFIFYLFILPITGSRQGSQTLSGGKIFTAGKSLGTLSKPRRRRQRGHGKTKDLIGRTIAQHVRFKTLYISQPSYAKQQRKITTICVVSELKPRRQIFVISIWSSTLLLYVMLRLRCGDV